MATLRNPSADDMRNARKVGKLPKKPKKPKQSASLNTLENYVSKHNAWTDKIKDMAGRYKKANGLKKSIFGRS